MENGFINIRVLQQDTCDQIRIGASFPAFKSDLDRVVDNLKLQYAEEYPHSNCFENLCDRYFRRVALVDAETLQSVREIYGNPENKTKPFKQA